MLAYPYTHTLHALNSVLTQRIDDLYLHTILIAAVLDEGCIHVHTQQHTHTLLTYSMRSTLCSRLSSCPRPSLLLIRDMDPPSVRLPTKLLLEGFFRLVSSSTTCFSCPLNQSYTDQREGLDENIIQLYVGFLQ